MDGGTTWNINIDSAVKQCLEIVDDPSQIVMDIMICGNPHLTNVDKTGNTIYNYKRKLSWWVYYQFLNAFAVE